MQEIALRMRHSVPSIIYLYQLQVDKYLHVSARPLFPYSFC